MVEIRQSAGKAVLRRKTFVLVIPNDKEILFLA